MLLTISTVKISIVTEDTLGDITKINQHAWNQNDMQFTQ